MENIFKEIIELTHDILESNCEGCKQNYGSQRDHSCLVAYHYNLALEEAIEIVRKNYNIEDTLEFIYDKYHIEEDY